MPGRVDQGHRPDRARGRRHASAPSSPHRLKRPARSARPPNGSRRTNARAASSIGVRSTRLPRAWRRTAGEGREGAGMEETIVRRRNVIRRDAMSRNVIQCLEANARPWHYSPGSADAADSFDALTRHTLETHGPLGTLIAGLGLGAFYAALTLGQPAAGAHAHAAVSDSADVASGHGARPSAIDLTDRPEETHGLHCAARRSRTARLLADRRVQQADRPEEPGRERVEADRRAAQAATRPDSEPREHREGRDAVRARDARSGRVGAEQGDPGSAGSGRHRWRRRRPRNRS